MNASQLIKKAVAEGRGILNEHESKKMLEAYNIPIVIPTHTTTTTMVIMKAFFQKLLLLVFDSSYINDSSFYIFFFFQYISIIFIYFLKSYKIIDLFVKFYEGIQLFH